jgi:glycosyltransferase involved in cell wall biosynthesis
MRVVHLPGDSDYNQSLYRAMPAGIEVTSKTPPIAFDEPFDADIVHVNWPEHFWDPGELAWDDFAARCTIAVERLARLPVKIVWTMHNRLPHAWSTGRRKFFKACAEAAHGVVHHSAWGMQLIRGELPFRPDAAHAVIAHGHYGDLFSTTKTRAQMEAELGLSPRRLRIGLTGRAQRTRGLRLIMEAFAASRNPDLELLVTAIKPGEWYPDDPRVVVRARDGWLPREAIVPQIRVCDALVVAIEGDSYLTSATHADSIGTGIPIIVNQWPFWREIVGDGALYFDGTAGDLTRLFDELTPEALVAPREATQRLAAKYTWEAHARALVELFQAVLSTRTMRSSLV